MASDYERVVARLRAVMLSKSIKSREAAADALALLRQMHEDVEKYGRHIPRCNDPTGLGRCACGWDAARERLGLR